MPKNDITIYTDGACLGNPGPGGYGAVILDGNIRRELSGGFRLTTNNRMELTAVIEALSSLPHSSHVKVISDSKYLVDAMTLGWLDQWRARRWRTSTKQKVLNQDLWKKLAALVEKHQVSFIWVQGHAGNRENERCDYLSTHAAKGRSLPVDAGFEETITAAPTLF